MKIDKQSVADVAWSVLGGVIGGVATGAFLVNRWLHQAHEGARASSTPSGLSQYQKPEEGKQ